MLVRAARPVRLECIARGHLFGSAWSEYEATRHGVRRRRSHPGLHQAEQLPEPIFTCTTKAESGHDETVDRRRGGRARGRRRRSSRSRAATLDVYRFGAAHAASQGLILADTKLEFGKVDGELLVIDEMLTRDSSRYWPAERLPGRDLAAVVRQAVRA